MIALDIVVAFARQHPWLLLLNVCMMVLVPLNDVVLPHLYGQMIVAISTPAWASTLLELIIALLVIQVGFILRDKLNERVKPMLEGFVKTEIVDMILLKHDTSFDELTTGDIVYRATKVPDVIMYWFRQLNDYVVPYLLVLVTAAVYFMRYDMVVGSVFLVFVAVLVGVFTLAPRACIEHSKPNDAVLGGINEVLAEIVNNMTSIYSSNSKRRELARLEDRCEAYGRTYARTATCTRAFKMALFPTTTVMVAFFVIRSRLLIRARAIHRDQFVSIFLVITSLLTSIFWMIELMRDSVLDVGTISNLDDVLLAPARSLLGPRPAGQPPPASASVVGLHEVTLSYAAGSAILDRVSVAFPPGKRTAIVGAVGSGKSTVLKVLLGFHRPESGDAYLGGRWYRDLDVREVRASIGYVPQNPVLFNDTVLYNVAYGNDGATYTEIRELAALVGFDEAFLRRGVGKNGMHLSGGQRQLVWCLRVLLKGPPIVVMDEPTASMDAASKDALMVVMDRMMADRTVIMITHDPYLLRFADHTVRM
jgi:ABC-type multidrug transport system fused ATPase/permease subunit